MSRGSDDRMELKAEVGKVSFGPSAYKVIAIAP